MLFVVVMFLVLCCLLSCQGTFGAEFHIKNAQDLIKFSGEVNEGGCNEGTTAFLDADIDFSGGLSEQFEPIGKDLYNYFQGTFDGQGYTISNLTLSSSFEYAGLFGHSVGATIRNVVLDSSCSFISSNAMTYTYIGGLIGRCMAHNKECTFLSLVNMAKIAFIGNNSYYNLFLGGVAGKVYAWDYNIGLSNCVNVSDIINFGIVGGYAEIGGIIGLSEGRLLNKISIVNCYNYGNIIDKGSVKSYLYIGGILGDAWNGINILENCVSAGKVTFEKGYVGSIVGFVSSYTSILHCYWTTDFCENKAYGSKYSSATIKETYPVSLNITTINVLNNYRTNLNKWVLNKNNNSIFFIINGGKGFTFSSQLILLPDPFEDSQHNFSEWFTDIEFSKKFIKI